MDNAFPKSTKQDLSVRKKWMINNVALVKKYVRAIINNVDDRFLKMLSNFNIEKIYGVPGISCSRIDEAIDWIFATLTIEVQEDLDKEAIPTDIKPLIGSF